MVKKVERKGKKKEEEEEGVEVMKTDKQKFKKDLTKELEDRFGKEFVNEKIKIVMYKDDEVKEKK